MSFLSSALPWGVVSEFESYFFRVLLQLVAIIVVARVSGWCFVRMGQPMVVGEIVGGLAMGPTLLGRFAPDFSAAVFDTKQADVLHVISEIGLVLLMFLVGLEFDFGHLRHVGSTAVRIAVAGVVFPFAAGSALAWWMHPRLAEEVNRTGFVLIVAIAMSITAIPILGRIMIELGIQRSALGTLTISAAAIDDACGWILLALASAVVQGDLRWTQSLYIAMNTVFFIAACYWLGSRWFVRWIPRLMVPQPQRIDTRRACRSVGAGIAGGRHNESHRHFFHIRAARLRCVAIERSSPSGRCTATATWPGVRLLSTHFFYQYRVAH
ncbi:MAG: cation:proton antiporter [Pirellulaceae bacterium]